MFMTATLSGLLACAAIFTTVAANATTEQALVCQGCNYQQAVSLAKSHAQPGPQCEDGSGTGYPTLETQICFSQPKKFVVFDAVSRQAYPFEVFHANQGGSISDLRSSIATRDRTVHPTVIELLNVGVDMHIELMSSFDQTAQRLISYQQTKVAQQKANASYAMPSGGCENDADAKAIRDAFDVQAIGTLQRIAQIDHREQTDGILNSLMSFFDRNTVSLDSVDFQLTKDEITVGASVVYSPKTKSFTAIYNSASDISLVDGRAANAVGTPILVYDIKTNSDSDLLVQVNKNNSYLSSNVPLSAVTNGTGAEVSVSSCAADAIAAVLPNVQFSVASGNGFGETPPSGPGGGSGGGSPENDCTRVLFGKANGTVVLVLTVNIC
ncbi:hypothetical protein [Rheinheimera maricola]|uniref:Uncharacterized protein n=1 Tax=Rheinheimera maricola TaxID=2793282 RepID=A0ABS7XF73_9GAMM|nr:hypothetical protein [Rheinheimera maricola]MBZ9613805.1 hypothetical protein [Rheinheimera maricola]